MNNPKNKIYVVFDIDETLLNPIPKWVEYFEKHYKLNLTEKEISYYGSIQKLINSKYVKYNNIDFEKIRRIEDICCDLPSLNDSVDAVKYIQKMKGVYFACYLTARPHKIESETRKNLLEKGFPNLDIIFMDNKSTLDKSYQWKFENLNNLRRTLGNTIVSIDDNVFLAKEIVFNGDKRIIPITIKGPFYEYQKRFIDERPNIDFNFMSWNAVPAFFETILV